MNEKIETWPLFVNKFQSGKGNFKPCVMVAGSDWLVDGVGVISTWWCDLIVLVCGFSTAYNYTVDVTFLLVQRNAKLWSGVGAQDHVTCKQ